jgi:hypothetical protein
VEGEMSLLGGVEGVDNDDFAAACVSNRDDALQDLTQTLPAPLRCLVGTEVDLFGEFPCRHRSRAIRGRVNRGTS